MNALLLRRRRNWADLARPVARTLLWFAQGVMVTHLFMQHGYWVSPVAGPSMLPTLEVAGAACLVSKRHRRGRGVALGDVVVYDIPINGDEGVKRVLGLPGDYVLIDTPGEGREAMMQVPPGHCWLIGDNLPSSRDSRMFGPVPLALIKGKVIAKVWPPGEMKWIENSLQSP